MKNAAGSRYPGIEDRPEFLDTGRLSLPICERRVEYPGDLSPSERAKVLMSG